MVDKKHVRTDGRIDRKAAGKLKKMKSLANDHVERKAIGNIDIINSSLVNHSSLKGWEDADWPKLRFDLIVCVRFLQRNFLRSLVNMIKLHGFIVYHTFAEGCEKFGHPTNPDRILKKGELASYFSSANGFKILLDEIRCESDGRPMYAFCATKIQEF